MEFNQTLLFFFSALGAFNGLCLGLYFLFGARPKHSSNVFLGTLLLILSVRIGKSVFFYFQPDLAFIYLQIGLSICFFIGPFLYFYVLSLKGKITISSKSWRYHLLLLVLLITLVGIRYPFESNTAIWRPYIIYGIYMQWLFYSIAAGWELRDDLAQLVDQPKKINAHQLWVLSIYIGILLIWTAYSFTSYTYYIVGALTFSFLFYLLVLQIFLYRRKGASIFIPTHKYKAKKITDVEASELLKRIETYMQQDEPFTNPDLKSSEVAQKVQLSVHQLSQLLNDNLGKSFPLFINELRIQKAIDLMVSQPNLTLEAIGYDCGFNSKSTFYTTFKKIMGCTPAQYKTMQTG